MTVYVDDARIAATVGRVKGSWSHLFADTPDELHAFAARIGLRRSWFQGPPDHWFAHYDVTESKRLAAIRAGATAVTVRESVQIIRVIRSGGRPAGHQLSLGEES